MNKRINLMRGKQRAFINTILKNSQLSIEQLADRCGVSPRTFRDWRREKYHGSFEILKALSHDFKVSLPKGKILNAYWYVKKGASIGARKRLAMYGPPGTPEGRKKGGIVSQKRRRENPEIYRALGCNIAKDFILPKHSADLAELVGIFLGDGGLTSYQAKITLSALVDREYSYFVKDLIGRVFKIEPSICERKKGNVIELVISGTRFIDNLESLGLRRGDKIRNRIKIPEWILQDDKYALACTRGLFDTDGGLYFHKKQSGVYIGWCFCSFSPPLLNDVQNILRRIDLNVKKEQDRKLYIYNLRDICRYMEIIGSHNMKNIYKFHSHIAERGQKMKK